MAAIKLNSLGGLYPAVLPRALPDDGAQVASNLFAGTNEFRPLATDTTVTTSAVSNPQTLYRLARKADGSLSTDMATGWKTHAAVINYVKGQLNDDAKERTYYTYGDGSAAPRALDATGQDRQLGVPSPLTKLTLALNEVYTFTPELRDIELASAKEKIVQAILGVGNTPVLVGLGSLLPTPGWVMESDFDTSDDAKKHVIRVFAVNPATNAIISTYSNMPPAEASWVFDPALGGYYAEKPVGYTVPAWATGHTKWWCVRLRAFAQAFDINSAALTTALGAIAKPGTQGAEDFLTVSDISTIVTRLTTAADKDEVAVKTMIDAMQSKQSEVADMFNQGGATSLVQAVGAFYAKTEVSTAIESAKDAFAEQIWRYAEMIGSATTAPWYDNAGA